jgi:protein gp37
MAEHTLIAWADATFNGWTGCTKVSDACKNCYAEAEQDLRFHLVRWGRHQPRHHTAESTWKKPLVWQRKAVAAGVRKRVFAFSDADIFDDEVDPQWRTAFWALVAQCPNLDWILLTKRPLNIPKMLPAGWPWPHVWLGVTAENQLDWGAGCHYCAALPPRGASFRSSRCSNGSPPTSLASTG